MHDSVQYSAAPSVEANAVDGSFAASAVPKSEQRQSTRKKRYRRGRFGRFGCFKEFVRKLGFFSVKARILEKVKSIGGGPLSI